MNGDYCAHGMHRNAFHCAACADEYMASVETATGGGMSNPLFLGDESDHCPVCGCRLRDNRLLELKPCPWGPHTEETK